MKTLILLAAAPVVLLAAPASSQNLVGNGSFESTTAPSYQAIPGGDSTTLSPWTTINGGVEWFKPNPYLPGLSGPAHSGVSIVDLAYSASGGGLQQSFTTVSGKTYRLTFYGLTANSYGRNGTGTINVGLDGIGNLYTANLARAAGNWTLGDWQPFTTTFVGNGLSQTLSFSNTENENLNFAFLDDVSVTAVPEPATWAMMILGFGMVGAASRYRRRATRAAFAA